MSIEDKQVRPSAIQQSARNFHSESTRNREHDMLTRMLVREITSEVEKAIREATQPKVDAMYKEAAMIAVGKWNISYREQAKDDLIGTTEIMVKFVEEVVRTNYQKVVVTEVADGKH